MDDFHPALVHSRWKLCLKLALSSLVQLFDKSQLCEAMISKIEIYINLSQINLVGWIILYCYLHSKTKIIQDNVSLVHQLGLRLSFSSIFLFMCARIGVTVCFQKSSQYTFDSRFVSSVSFRLACAEIHYKKLTQFS